MTIRQKSSLLIETFGKSALRQPIFSLLLIVPLIMGVFLRLALIAINRYLPVLEVDQWLPLILAITVLFPPYLFGTLAALMLLDEKDKELLPALLVTPVRREGLIAAKIVPAAIMAAVGAPLCIELSGLSTLFSNGLQGLTALAAAPLAVFNCLLIIRFSGNKVQALTFAKVSGSLLIAPVGLALIDSPWRYIFLIFPGSSQTAVLVESAPLLWFIPALLYPVLLVAFLWKPTIRSYFG